MVRTAVKSITTLPTAIIIATLLIIAPLAAAVEPAVTYDPVTDRLSIQATDVSLAKLLGRIVLLSGVEIRLDPAAEQMVSLNFEDKPLETGLKHMAVHLDLDHAMVYGRKEATAPVLLVGMAILPQGGKALTGGPSPLVVPTSDEAAIRALPAENPTADGDITRARWAERLKKLPPDIRQQLAGLGSPAAPMTDQQKAQAALHQEKQAALKQRLAEKKQARELKRQAHQERLEAFKAERPDLYEERLERQQELLDLTQ